MAPFTRTWMRLRKHKRLHLINAVIFERLVMFAWAYELNDSNLEENAFHW